LQLSDDRREEVFVRVSDLAIKLDVLPPEARLVFAPLGLAAKLTTPVAAPTPLPDPTPAVAAPAERWLGSTVRVQSAAEHALQQARSLWNLRQFGLAQGHRGLSALREALRRFRRSARCALRR